MGCHGSTSVAPVQPVNISLTLHIIISLFQRPLNLKRWVGLGLQHILIMSLLNATIIRLCLLVLLVLELTYVLALELAHTLSLTSKLAIERDGDTVRNFPML